MALVSGTSNGRILKILVAGLALSGCTRQAAGWSEIAAARYLDHSAAQWLAWPDAQRDERTVCISCHTALPYLLVRDALPSTPKLPRAQRPAAETRLLASVDKRVQLGMVLPPYYPEQALAARGTEGVLNALILAHQDFATGQLTALTQRALAQLWALQISSGSQAGSWPWINFRNEPWEAPDSSFVGATFAALAIGYTPRDYLAHPEVQVGLRRLLAYLDAAYGHEPLLNRIGLLWASGRLPQLLTPATKSALISEIWRYQRADGGWNAASLMPDWKRRDSRRQPTSSDGYATGFVALALQEGGVTRNDARLTRALRWLKSQQGFWSGGWSAQSLNRRHDHGEFSGHFMDDAATAYAVLALTAPRNLEVATAALVQTSAQPSTICREVTRQPQRPDSPHPGAADTCGHSEMHR